MLYNMKNTNPSCKYNMLYSTLICNCLWWVAALVCLQPRFPWILGRSCTSEICAFHALLTVSIARWFAAYPSYPLGVLLSSLALKGVWFWMEGESMTLTPLSLWLDWLESWFHFLWDLICVFLQEEVLPLDAFVRTALVSLHMVGYEHNPLVPLVQFPIH